MQHWLFSTLFNVAIFSMDLTHPGSGRTGRWADGRTGGRTGGPADGRTDGRAGGRAEGRTGG